ncbi:MAG: hypothetical protein NTV68_09865 [Methanomicrobiales archaeon]|nr:hypothetical protein [Methanomicrobiales archaeon]
MGVVDGRGEWWNRLIFAITRPENGGILEWLECREPMLFQAWTFSSNGSPLPETTTGQKIAHTFTKSRPVQRLPYGYRW